MQIPPLPSAEVRKSILDAHAHRFPQRFTFHVAGDRGAKESIAILLGIPSGASKMPDPRQKSDAWELAVAATFKPSSFTIDKPLLVSDCVLWPEPQDWSAIVRRWPALPASVFRKLCEKYGGATKMLVAPGPNEQPPPAIAEALDARPSAVWLQLKPTGQTIDIAVTPPDMGAWQLFDDAMKDGSANCWALALDLANASMVGSTMPVSDLFARWPGLALLVAVKVSDLAGIAAQAESGEF